MKKALVLAVMLVTGAFAQTGVVFGPGTGMQAPTPGNPFSGSVTVGEPTGQTLDLSLAEAIRRGVEHNLGTVLSGVNQRYARGERIIALSRLLPHLEAEINETSQQINLAAFGFTGFPGVPAIVGPFGLFDARAKVTQEVVNLRWMYNNRASQQQVKATELSGQDARDTVVMIVAALYWQSVAAESRIEAAQAQITTAVASLQLARDQKDAGLVPAIDVLRADVELQAERQRLIADQSAFEQQKLRLAQAIGIPSGQALRLTDTMNDNRLADMDLDRTISAALQTRLDYQSQAAKVQAAEMARKSIRSARLPSLNFEGNYGTIGKSPAESHGTYMAKIDLNIPIFAGGAERGADVEAQAELDRQKALLDELRSRIGFEIRSAMLDLKAAADQVQVSRNAVNLAREAEAQARDRFGAGVTNNLEVVQAQQGLAAANENLIASLYTYNVAKVALARAMGGTEKNLTAWQQPVQ